MIRSCPAGDGTLDVDDLVSLRRRLAGVEELGCEPCLVGESLPGLRRPADVAPAGAPDGRLDVADVLLLLRLAVGLIGTSPELTLIGDVAPSALDGALSIVVGDDVVDIGDVLLALRATVGLEELAWPLRELILRAEDESAFLAFSSSLDGWPAWAQVEGVETEACEGGGGIDQLGSSCTITCASDPLLVQGPADLARIAYRAPEAVEGQEIELRGQLLDDALNAVAATWSLRAP